MPIVVHHPMQFVTKSKKGNGEYAGLPQEILRLARCPRTYQWKRGARVMDTKGLTPRTVIATFNSNGDYYFVPDASGTHGVVCKS
jgi:hypothetical protein